MDLASAFVFYCLWEWKMGAASAIGSKVNTCRTNTSLHCLLSATGTGTLLSYISLTPEHPSPFSFAMATPSELPRMAQQFAQKENNKSTENRLHRPMRHHLPQQLTCLMPLPSTNAPREPPGSPLRSQHQPHHQSHHQSDQRWSRWRCQDPQNRRC
jgi:hypothetical protein